MVRNPEVKNYEHGKSSPTRTAQLPSPLDTLLYFGNYGSMEGNVIRSADADQQFQFARATPEHPVITDEAVLELTRQAPDGCVLCELEHLDEEDWD